MANAFRLFKKPQMQELWRCLEQQMQLNLSEGMKAGRLTNELNLNGREKAEIYTRAKENGKIIVKGAFKLT
ncbi:hypothetical protein ACKI1O_50850, partial [Streptomyces scabiei]